MSTSSNNVSPSPSKRVLVVLGATGAQGCSVVHYGVSSGDWQVRALTRDPSSEKAQKLLKDFPSLKLVKGDVDDQLSLKEAFEGATAVFAMTDFYTPTNLDRLKKEGRLGELEQGVLIADAAKAAGVQYVLWSGLHNTELLTGNASENLEGVRPATAVMFSAKNMVEQYAKSIGLKVIGVWPGFFVQNLPNGLLPAMHVLPDGTLEWSIPVRADLGLPVINIDQMGHYVLKALENAEEWVGKRILIASEYMTLDQMARVYQEVTGQRTRFRSITYAEYREQQASTPWVEAYVEMFRHFNTRGYFAGESLDETEQKFGLTDTFRQWLVKSKWRADIEKLKKLQVAKSEEKTLASIEEKERVMRYARSSVKELIKNSPQLQTIPAETFFSSSP